MDDEETKSWIKHIRGRHGGSCRLSIPMDRGRRATVEFPGDVSDDDFGDFVEVLNRIGKSRRALKSAMATYPASPEDLTA